MSSTYEGPYAASEILRQPGWDALRVAMTAARESFVGRVSTDLVTLAKNGVNAAHTAGFASHQDGHLLRFTGRPRGITRWQDQLYAVNEHPLWQYTGDLLLVGWLIECGGPAMGRGPAKARYERYGPEHYVGGTRIRCNMGTHGHGGPEWPKSNAYTYKPRGRSRGLRVGER